MNSPDRLDVFRQWVLEDPGTHVPLSLAVLGLLLVLPLVTFAVYMWRMTTRAMAERAFPPSGYTVLGRAAPTTGDAAIRSARLVRALAIFLLIAAVVLILQLWRFARLLSPGT